MERREARKQTLKSALRSKSRAVMDDIVNESSRLISSLTKSKEGDEGQDDEAEDWF